MGDDFKDMYMWKTPWSCVFNIVIL